MGDIHTLGEHLHSSSLGPAASPLTPGLLFGRPSDFQRNASVSKFTEQADSAVAQGMTKELHKLVASAPAEDKDVRTRTRA